MTYVTQKWNAYRQMYVLIFVLRQLIDLRLHQKFNICSAICEKIISLLHFTSCQALCHISCFKIEIGDVKNCEKYKNVMMKTNNDENEKTIKVVTFVIFNVKFQLSVGILLIFNIKLWYTAATIYQYCFFLKT